MTHIIRNITNTFDKSNSDGVDKKKKRSSLDEIATISDSDVFLIVYDAYVGTMCFTLKMRSCM